MIIIKNHLVEILMYFHHSTFNKNKSYAFFKIRYIFLKF